MEKIIEREKYISRLIDEMVDRYLTVIGAVCIEGPTWCDTPPVGWACSEP